LGFSGAGCLIGYQLRVEIAFLAFVERLELSCVVAVIVGVVSGRHIIAAEPRRQLLVNLGHQHWVYFLL